jgi:hypothetical protein
MPRILDLEILYHKNYRWSKKNSLISYEVKLVPPKYSVRVGIIAVM